MLVLAVIDREDEMNIGKYYCDKFEENTHQTSLWLTRIFFSVELP